MNRSDIADQVAKRTGLKTAQAAEAVEAVFDTLLEALKGDDEVRIAGFGVFDVVETKERVARNLRTQEPMHVPAGKRARFRPGKSLKDALGG
ncbi:MAG TPA: DNA-binding protein HU [Hyphomonadaceae bacterium]|nr:DNA-binding protein HU [Hyphomonadaceae bacterium]